MSAPLPGFVYYDPNFVFHDGETGKKLFVVLCDSPLDDQLVVVARTTSNSKTDPIFGCYLDTFPPCFHLPDNINNFDTDTWIMLDWVVEYDATKLQSMIRTTDLSVEHTIALLNCGANCQYLDKWQVDALKKEAERLSPK